MTENAVHRTVIPKRNGVRVSCWAFLCSSGLSQVGIFQVVGRRDSKKTRAMSMLQKPLILVEFGRRTGGMKGVRWRH